MSELIRKWNFLFFRTIRYVKYVLKSMNRKGHGIHSPFVFDLVSRVFRNKINTEIVSIIEDARKRMALDSRYITVKDLGKGPVKIRSKLRKVSDIVRNSPVPVKYGVLLSNMASEFGYPLILELGTSFGISTMYMASSVPAATVYTIEGCPEISEIANNNFNAAGIKNVELFTGSFDEVLPLIINRNIKPGLVFIDGDHRKEKVINYCLQIMKISDNKTVMIIDDISYSKDMREAWDEIKRFEEVSLTIDVYRMGIVFFKAGITHIDYVIRY